MAKDCCTVEDIDLRKDKNKTLRKVFWAVLLINLAMFFAEAIAGYLAHSNALWADALDMLGDVFVYSISLFVLTKSYQAKVSASIINGATMALLGLFIVVQTIYKIINPVLPTAETISIIGVIALIANAICFFLLIKYKDTDLNIKSSWICSRNDMTANISVVVAGFLVGYFNSMWPDIIVGLGIAFIVLKSSVEIILEGLKYKKDKASGLIKCEAGCTCC